MTWWKQTVELLPQLGTDLLAHLARVLARRRDAGGDRRRGCWDRKSESARSDRHRHSTPDLADCPARPARAASAGPALERGLVQHQVQLDIQHARGVLGALQIAAHPVQTVGDAREHDVYSLSTQVSLLPPPCDEFTTSDPLRSATRVSPPGTMVTLSPNKI